MTDTEAAPSAGGLLPLGGPYKPTFGGTPANKSSFSWAFLELCGPGWANTEAILAEGESDPLVPNMNVNPPAHTEMKKSERENKREQCPQLHLTQTGVSGSWGLGEERGSQFRGGMWGPGWFG